MLELMTLRFRRGQVGATDVLQQRRLVESGRGALSLAGANLQVLRHQLAVLIGRSPRDAVDDAGAALIDPPPLPATGVPSDLLQQRPDLRAARAELAAAGARVGAAVAERFPRLSLSASLSTGGAETANLFTEWLGNLAANLVAPLLDGGRRGAVVDQREAQLEQAFQAYRGAVLTALQEVEDALVQERRQAEYLRSLAAQLELADTVLERTRDSYLSGQVDYLRVLEALTSQQSLQLELLAARSQLVLYRIDLCRALGGDWDPQRPATTAASGGDREES
jgi:outer membrane protein TolC